MILLKSFIFLLGITTSLFGHNSATVSKIGAIFGHKDNVIKEEMIKYKKSVIKVEMKFKEDIKKEIAFITEGWKKFGKCNWLPLKLVTKTNEAEDGWESLEAWRKSDGIDVKKWKHKECGIVVSRETFEFLNKVALREKEFLNKEALREKEFLNKEALREKEEALRKKEFLYKEALREKGDWESLWKNTATLMSQFSEIARILSDIAEKNFPNRDDASKSKIKLGEFHKNILRLKELLIIMNESEVIKKQEKEIATQNENEKQKNENATQNEDYLDFFEPGLFEEDTMRMPPKLNEYASRLFEEDTIVSKFTDLHKFVTCLLKGEQVKGSTISEKLAKFMDRLKKIGGVNGIINNLENYYVAITKEPSNPQHVDEDHNEVNKEQNNKV